MQGAIDQTHWVDGTPITFTNWAGGRPMSTDGCVHFWKFTKLKWDDWACIYKHTYLCSKLVTSPNKDCAVVDAAGEWQAVDCALSYPFACSDKSSIPCA